MLHRSAAFIHFTMHVWQNRITTLYTSVSVGNSTKFDIQGSVHRKCIPKYDQQDATLHSFLFL